MDGYLLCLRAKESMEKRLGVALIASDGRIYLYLFFYTGPVSEKRTELPLCLRILPACKDFVPKTPLPYGLVFPGPHPSSEGKSLKPFPYKCLTAIEISPPTVKPYLLRKLALANLLLKTAKKITVILTLQPQSLLNTRKPAPATMP